MRTLLLALLLLAVSATVTRAQSPVLPLQRAPEGATIGIADVSGLPIDQLSPGLRDEINALVGMPLRGERLEALAMRIEGEKTDMIVAVRRTLLPDGGARVTFVVAHLTDDPELLANINSRYIIESATFAGIAEDQIKPDVLTQVKAVVGGKLEAKEGDRLVDLLNTSLPGYTVKRRFERGTEPGQLKLIFDVIKNPPPPWIRFRPSQSKIVYHAYQGWSAALDLPIEAKSDNASWFSDFKFTFGFSIADEDELIEQDSGFRVAVENRHVFTRRLGAALHFSRDYASWRDATLSAVASHPAIPTVYDNRWTVEPVLTFAFSPHVRVAGGFSATTLEPFEPELESFFDPVLLTGTSRQVNAAHGAVSYDQSWTTSGMTHEVAAAYDIRSASSSVGSDLDYTRHEITASYRYRQGRQAVSAEWMGGQAHGEVPLFERFSLGDTRTLRGWNKFDLAPAGGTRAFYQSLEYSYRGFALFLDAGSVWDAPGSASTKFSTGFGYHAKNVFLTLGIPLASDEGNVSFMMGVRF